MKFGLVFGGVSYEHEVSIISAIAVKKVLKNINAFIFCDKDRNFYLIEEKNMIAKFFSSGEYKKSKILNITNGGFVQNSLFSKSKIDVDVYINLIHGSDGEDGKIAGIFEFFGIKFIGSRLESSVLSFNKVLTKDLAKAAKVKSLEYRSVRRGESFDLSLPVILKPARLGSSLGVNVVNNEAELEYGLDSAFEYDDLILVEPFVEGVREYNLAGAKIAGGFVFSIIEEPQKNVILDFEKKYMDFSRSSEVKEADIKDELKVKMREAFERIYNVGGFGGALIRCDFFVIKDEVYLNEINPNPGSMANYLFSDFDTLINKLALNLPKTKNIKIDYKTINSIISNK